MARYSAWVGIFCFFLALESTAAFVYRVGGKKGWEVPSGNVSADAYNHWAGRHRFQIGDSLLFKYPRGSDSVLVVREKAYRTCNTSNPIVYSTNGDSIFRFTVSGPFYFIGGSAENCLNGQKLVIVVMADRDSSLGWNSPVLPQAPSVLPQAPSATVGNRPFVVSPSADSPAYRVPLTTGAGFAISARPSFVFSIFTMIACKLLFL